MNRVGWLIVLIVVTSAAFAGAMIWTVSSPESTLAVWVLVAVALAEPTLIMFGVFHFMWRPLAAQYPPQPHRNDAITKTFQSFSIGIINMGLSIHATVDDACLHLMPVRLLRFFGATPLSIPWGMMTLKGRSGRSARLGQAGPVLRGPKWCLRPLQHLES